MRISVITVNYNNKTGLEATIKSVIHQTFKDYEFIIIDGGSTDGSKEVINLHQEQIDYWVSERDKGVYNGMNKAIHIARGEYCIFMNSGDCFFSDTVLEEVFSKNPSSDYIAGNYSDGTVIKKSPKELTLRYMYEDAICHQAVFIRTSLLKSSPYDESYRIAADWAQMFDALILHDASYSYQDIVIASLQPDGMSKKGWKELADDRKQHLKEVLPQRILKSLQQEHIQQQITTEQSKLYAEIMYLSSSPKLLSVVKSLVSLLYHLLLRRNKEKWTTPESPKQRT